MKPVLRIFLANFMVTLIFFLALAYSAEIKIVGSPSSLELLKKKLVGFEEKTGIKITFIPMGPKFSLWEVYNDRADLAVDTIPLKNWIALLTNEGIEVPSTVFKEVVIGKERIVVITNKNNPVNRLSKSELAQILTGEVTSWSHFNWKDLPPLLILSRQASEAQKYFLSNIIGNSPLGIQFITVRSPKEQKLAVAFKENAIGIIQEPYVDHSVKVIQTPEVSRSIYLAYKNTSKNEILTLINYLKPQKMPERRR